MVNVLGKPDAGSPHVRFDEGDQVSGLVPTLPSPCSSQTNPGLQAILNAQAHHVTDGEMGARGVTNGVLAGVRVLVADLPPPVGGNAELIVPRRQPPDVGAYAAGIDHRLAVVRPRDRNDCILRSLAAAATVIIHSRAVAFCRGRVPEPNGRS